MKIRQFAIAHSRHVYEEWLDRNNFEVKPIYLHGDTGPLRGLKADQMVFHLLDGWEHSLIMTRDSQREHYFHLRAMGALSLTDEIGAERTRLREAARIKMLEQICG